MTVIVNRYVNRSAVGTGTGKNIANSYVDMSAAITAESRVLDNINAATVAVSSVFSANSTVLNFAPSGATANLIDQNGSYLSYEVLTGTPLAGDIISPATGVGYCTLNTVDDISGGRLYFNWFTGGTDETAAITLSGFFTTNYTNRPVIKGDWVNQTRVDNTKLILSTGNVNALTVAENYAQVVDMQINISPTSNSKRAVLHNGSGVCVVDSSYVWMKTTGNINYIRGVYSSSGSLTINNSIIEGFKRSSNDYIGVRCDTGILKVYNSVIDNCYTAVLNGSATPAVVKNSIISANIPSTGSVVFSNCAGTTAIGTGDVVVYSLDIYTLYNRYLGDYGLYYDSPLIGSGIPSSADPDVPAFDILGNARPATDNTIGVHFQPLSTTKPRVEYNFSEVSGALVANLSGERRRNGLIGSRLATTYTSPALGDYQGYTTDGINHYTTGSAPSEINKWSADFSTNLVKNAAPYTGYATTPSTQGSIQFYNGKLYVSVESYISCKSYSAAATGVFDANTLAYINSFDLATFGHDVGALALDVGRGYIYVVGYCSGDRVWIYDLNNPATLIATLDLEASMLCNGMTYDAATDSLYMVHSNSRNQSGNERIIQVSAVDGRVLASWSDILVGEMEDLDVSSGAFRYLAYPDSKMRESTISVPPTRNAAELNLVGQYLDVQDTLSDTGSIVIVLTPNSFYNTNTILDTPALNTEWNMSIDSAGLLSFNVSGVSPVTYLLPLATSSVEIGLTWQRNGSNVDVILYVDKVARANAVQTYVAPNDRYFSLGAGNSNNSSSAVTLHYFYMDSKVLSAAEITAFVPSVGFIDPALTGDATITGGTPSLNVTTVAVVNFLSSAVTGSIDTDGGVPTLNLSVATAAASKFGMCIALRFNRGLR